MPKTGDTDMIMDGVVIPLPTPEESDAFDKWTKKNNIKEPFHKDQHYDYVSAFRKGISKTNNHFPDTYKTPGHETFSIESKYYKPGMPAGKWEDGIYVPLGRSMSETKENGEIVPYNPNDIFIPPPKREYDIPFRAGEVVRSTKPVEQFDMPVLKKWPKRKKNITI